MSNNIGKYIETLSLQSGLSQADLAREIKVSRQSLNYVICGKRELSVQMALKIESYFSLPDGELLKMQALNSIVQRKQSLREHLCRKLMDKNAFWSYKVQSFDSIPDTEIIEKCFTVLDIDDIDLMFELYPRNLIFKVWKEQMAIKGDYMQMLNVMIVMYYFGIKEPEKYLKKIEKQHIKKLLKGA